MAGPPRPSRADRLDEIELGMARLTADVRRIDAARDGAPVARLEARVDGLQRELERLRAELEALESEHHDTDVRLLQHQERAVTRSQAPSLVEGQMTAARLAGEAIAHAKRRERWWDVGKLLLAALIGVAAKALVDWWTAPKF